MSKRWLLATLTTLRRLALVPLLLRLVVAATAAIAIVATTLPAWEAPDAYVVIAVLAAVGYVVAPDSGNGLVFSGAIVVTWLAGAPGGVGPAVVVTALALLVGHVAAAVAGSIPVTARADPAVALRWARPTAAIAFGVVVAAAVVAVLDARSLPGSAVITVAAIGGVTLAAWRWSAPD